MLLAMSAALRILALLVLLPAVLAGCTAGVRGGGDGAEPRRAAAEVPVVFRIVAGGRAGLLLDDAGRGVLALRRDGAEEAREVSFTNGGWTPARLAPGRWEITHLGPLRCRGLGFDVAGEGGPRILGTLRVEVLETSQYLVALMASLPTRDPTEALAAAFSAAEETGASPARRGPAPARRA